MVNKQRVLLRSMLYVPAYQKNFLRKIDTLSPDAIILDLEDSIPQDYKVIARRNIFDFFSNFKIRKDMSVFVRINSIESNMLLEDLPCVMSKKVDGIMMTKIYSAEDMVYYDKLITQYEKDYNLLEGQLSFVPLIETASAVMDVYNIAKSTKRIIAMALGGEDFLNDMGGFHGWSNKNLDYARAKIAVAARSVGALPIDTPYLMIRDEKGFREEERAIFEMGFAGIQCLSPRQIPLANQCFWPTEDEIEKSRRIVNTIEQASLNGSNVVMLDGNMVGPPMQRRAKKIIDLIEG